MEQRKILLAGFGKMGGYYANNIAEHHVLRNTSLTIADTDLDACKRALENVPHAASVHWITNTNALAPEGITISRNVADIIDGGRMNGFINATQTDAHLDVLQQALSVTNRAGNPVIKSVLQEKPFGLFDGNDEQFNDVCNSIRTNDVQFNLNSILMFSDIWHVADTYLSHFKDFKIVQSECIYGNNGANDIRPAHEGVFDTEGTHAIGILRGRGRLKRTISYRMSTLTQGPFGHDEEMNYECAAIGSHSGGDVHLSMSLAFDKNYRQVTHHIMSSSKNFYLRLEFDKGGTDMMTIYDTQGSRVDYCGVPAGSKLKNSIRATFATKSAINRYGLDRTLDLKETLRRLKEDSIVITHDEQPVIAPPNMHCLPR